METKKIVKTKRCVVTSSKMDKSRVAKIERMVQHPIVGKYIKQSTKIMFDDPKNETKVGDQVLVRSCVPKSKNKCFELVSIIRHIDE